MMKLVIFAALVAQVFGGTTYHLQTKVAGLAHSSSDPKLKVTIIGSAGKVTTGKIDTKGHNDFQRHHLDSYSFANLKEVGEIKCLKFENGNSDALLLDYVTIYSSTHKTKRYLYNEKNTKLSTNKKEGSKTLELCVKGDTTYIVTTVTSNKKDAKSTGVHLRMKITGERGTVTTGYFVKSLKDDFKEGATDIFQFYDQKNVGAISCVELVAQGVDKWCWDTITVIGGLQYKVLTNPTAGCVSKNSKEGKPKWKLC